MVNFLGMFVSGSVPKTTFLLRKVREVCIHDFEL